MLKGTLHPKIHCFFPYPVTRVFFQGGCVNGRSRLPQRFLHTAAVQKHILLPGVAVVIAKHLWDVITQLLKKTETNSMLVCISASARVTARDAEVKCQTKQSLTPGGLF